MRRSRLRLPRLDAAGSAEAMETSLEGSAAEAGPAPLPPRPPGRYAPVGSPEGTPPKAAKAAVTPLRLSSRVRRGAAAASAKDGRSVRSGITTGGLRSPHLLPLGAEPLRPTEAAAPAGGGRPCGRRALGAEGCPGALGRGASPELLRGLPVAAPLPALPPFAASSPFLPLLPGGRGLLPVPFWGLCGGPISLS